MKEIGKVHSATTILPLEARNWQILTRELVVCRPEPDIKVSVTGPESWRKQRLTISPRNDKLARTPETETEQRQAVNNEAEEEVVAESDACPITRTAMPIARLQSPFPFCNDRNLICDNVRRADNKLSIYSNRLSKSTSRGTRREDQVEETGIRFILKFFFT